MVCKIHGSVRYDKVMSRFLTSKKTEMAEKFPLFFFFLNKCFNNENSGTKHRHVDPRRKTVPWLHLE